MLIVKYFLNLRHLKEKIKMEINKITSKNRDSILGKQFVLSDDISISLKLTYIEGINYFDGVLLNTSAAEIGAVIQMYKRPNGLEIRLAKQFKYFSIGIQYDEIISVTKIFKYNLWFLKIELKNDKALIFQFKEANQYAITNFFKKLDILIESKNENIELDSNLLKTRTFKYRKMGNVEFTIYWLFTLLLGIVGYLFINNLFFLLCLTIISLAINATNGVYRLRDLEKPALYVLAFLFVPLINIYFLFIFMTKKGILHEKMKKEILI